MVILMVVLGDDSIGGWNPQPVRTTIEFRGTQVGFPFSRWSAGFLSLTAVRPGKIGGVYIPSWCYYLMVVWYVYPSGTLDFV